MCPSQKLLVSGLSPISSFSYLGDLNSATFTSLFLVVQISRTTKKCLIGLPKIFLPKHQHYSSLSPISTHLLSALVFISLPMCMSREIRMSSRLPFICRKAQITATWLKRETDLITPCTLMAYFFKRGTTGSRGTSIKRFLFSPFQEVVWIFVIRISL